MAIKLVDLHRALTAEIYGDSALRGTDTLQYLNGIEARMLPVDRSTEKRLLEIRTNIDRSLSDADSALALALAQNL
jgi:hypothetical protein